MAALTREQKIWRSFGVGSSDAEIIMSGDRKKWDKLIEEKKNPELERDGRDMLLKKLGQAVEAVCIDWFHDSVEPLRAVNVQTTYAADEYFRATLDAMTGDGLPVEAKFHSADKTMEGMVDWYFPQLQHQMLVCEVDRIWLAVIFGHYGKFEAVRVERDRDWLTDYQLAVCTFRHYQQTGEFLGQQLVAPPPVIFKDAPHVWKPTDKDYNEVTSAAIDFTITRKDAELHASARERLKALMPADRRLAVWRRGDEGIQISRNKAGAISFKVLNGD